MVGRTVGAAYTWDYFRNLLGLRSRFKASKRLGPGLGLCGRLLLCTEAAHVSRITPVEQRVGLMKKRETGLLLHHLDHSEPSHCQG